MNMGHLYIYGARFVFILSRVFETGFYYYTVIVYSSIPLSLALAPNIL